MRFRRGEREGFSRGERLGFIREERNFFLGSNDAKFNNKKIKMGFVKLRGEKGELGAKIFRLGFRLPYLF